MLAARHEHVPVPIASITKLMTALVVLEAGKKLWQKALGTKVNTAPLVAGAPEDV